MIVVSKSINYWWYMNKLNVWKKPFGFIYSLGEKHLGTSTISFRGVLGIFLPILIDLSLVTFINVINVAMISSSGTEAVAAVSMVDSLNMLLVNLFIAIATGGTVVVAQYKGKGDRENMSISASQSITSSVVIALALTVSMIIFSRPILSFIFQSANAQVLDYGYIYLLGSCISYPFFAINQSVIGSYRGMGESRTAMMFSVFINGLFLIFNFLFIKLLGMGVLGISISIVVCRILGAVFAIFYMAFFSTTIRVKAKWIFSFRWKIQKSILLIGMPSASEQVFFNGGKLLTQTFIAGLGTVAMATNAIASSIITMYYIPVNAVTLTVITVVGQCIGAGKVDSAKRFIKNAVIASSILAAVVCLLFAPFSGLLLSLYNPIDEVKNMSYPLLFLCMFAIPLLWSMGFVTPSGLRGAGDAGFTSITALTTMWTIRIGLGWVLTFTFGLGLLGIFIAMVVEWGVRGTVFLIRLRGKKWYKHKIV